MAIARSKKEVIRYVLRDDRELPKEQQTVFLLRPLSNVQVASIDAMVDIDLSGTHARVPAGQQRLVALKAGLAGWEGYLDEQGTPVAFAVQRGVRSIHGIECQDPPSDATLAWLAAEHWTELADAIRDASRLKAADIPN